MVWRILGGESYGLVTLAFLLIGSGAFGFGTYHAGLRQWKIEWKYLCGSYALAALLIIVIARGLISLFGG